MSDSDGSDGYDWPEDTPVGRKLAALEENLLCPICSGLFNNPHVLRCGHSYCSICIRKHFDANLNRTSSDTCPSCREKADSFDLKKNSQLSSIVRAFRALRPDMLSMIKDAQSVGEETKRAKSQQKTGAISVGSSVGVAITRRLPHYNFHGVKKDKVKSTLMQLTSESKATIRLDGDKDVLERRVRAFVHLSNSQVGSDTPLGLDQVVRHVNQEETQMEKESNKGLRSAGKLEKIRNGEVVKDVENGFQGLAQKVREQKEAALRKIATAAALQAPGQAQSQQVSDPPSSSGSSGSTSAGAVRVGASGGVSLGAMESAQLVTFLEQQVDRGYDWGPWRVVMSRRLGRPFFYNSITKIGQFAVPPELNVVPSPTQSQEVVYSQSQQIQMHMQVQNEGAPSQAPHDLPNASQMAFDHYQANLASNHLNPFDHAHQLPQHFGGGASGLSVPTNPSVPSGSLSLHGNDGVVHYDQYLDEEESPFHLLWDSGHHEMDELDPASFLLPDHASSVSAGLTHRPPTAPTAHTSTASSLFTGAGEATAVSTAMDLPNPTPFPARGGGGGGSGGGMAYSDMSATSSVGGPSTPWVVVDDDLVALDVGGTDAPHYSHNFLTSAQCSAPIDPHSAPLSGTQTSWACQACTFHNPMTTYTCDMCSTVDQVVQQSFSRPLLRSHLQTPAGNNPINHTGRSQRLSQTTFTPSKLSGSKTKPPPSVAKSTKKSKR